jgi:lysophospholipase L1-like esterase
MFKAFTLKIKILIAISLLLNLLFLYKVSKDYYKTYQQEHKTGEVTYLFNRQTVYKLLPIAKKDIVFIGDSHTQKFDVAEFFNNMHIKNRGIDGDVTAGVLNRLSDITKGHPDKIFLQIGINDIFQRKDIINAIPNYRRIIRRILEDSSESKIYIESIIPSSFANQDTVIKYNNIIQKISKDNGLTFIDLYDKFNDSGKLKAKYDCGDSIHLNGEGYVLWSEILKPYL